MGRLEMLFMRAVTLALFATVLLVCILEDAEGAKCCSGGSCCGCPCSQIKCGGEETELLQHTSKDTSGDISEGASKDTSEDASKDTSVVSVGCPLHLTKAWDCLRRCCCMGETRLVQGRNATTEAAVSADNMLSLLALASNDADTAAGWSCR